MHVSRKSVVLFGSLVLLLTGAFQGLACQVTGNPAVEPRDTPKSLGNTNPILNQRFGADPAALEYKGRLYIYSTADILERNADGTVKDNSYSKITRLNMISSDDLVNWTDHGTIDVAGPEGAAADWANNSWAPTVAMKNIGGKDRFFIYFANSAGGIGVLTADSPTGPFTDPIGEPLVSKMTKNCRDIPWLFDPAVLVEGDKAWLYFGGGVAAGMDEHPMSARVVQLGADMISLVGVPKLVDAPWLFEDSGINKVGSKYIYTYCANWANRTPSDFDAPKAEIIAMESTSPMGPFKFLGSVLKNPGSFFGGWGNNHHQFVQFLGKWYVAYHSFVIQDGLGYKGIYRSLHLDKAAVDANDHFVPVQASLKGVDQLKPFNPYQKVSAATMAYWGGAFEVDCSKSSDLKSGDWFGLKGVDFGSTGSSEVMIDARAGQAGGKIAVYADNFDSAPLVVVNVTAGASGAYASFKAKGNKVSGVHDLLFLCTSGEVSVKSWQWMK